MKLKLTQLVTTVPCALFCASLAAQLPAFQKVLDLPESSAATMTYRIATSDDGVMFWVNHDSLMALVKLDVNGDLLWSREYPSGPGLAWRIYDLAPTNDGGAVAMLESWNEILSPNHHVVLARIDTDGLVVWSRRFTLDGVDYHSLIYAHITGNDAGEFFVHLAPSFVGYQPHRIMKLDAMGNLLWSVSFDCGVGDGAPRQLFPVAGGGCLLVAWPWGSFGGAELPIALFDSSGNLVWGRSIKMNNTTWFTYAGSAICCSTGDVYIAGDQQAPPGLSPDYGFLIKIAPNGDLRWYKLYGTGSGPGQFGIVAQHAQLPSGDLRFTGNRIDVFDSSGVHLAHSERDFVSYSYGSIDYSLNRGSTPIASDDFLTTGNWEEADSFFGYTWYHPVVMRTPWNLSGSCGWSDILGATAPDTLVPATFIDYVNAGSSGPVVYSSNDTTILSIPVPLALYDFCTLLGVDEAVAPPSLLEVYPTILPAGTTLTANAPDAASIELFDPLGRMVRKVAMHQSDRIELGTDALGTGLYLVRARDQAGRLIGAERVVIE